MARRSLPVPQLPPAESYSEPRFWRKLLRVGRTAGRGLVEKSLWLYFAARRPETPGWARAAVYGALAYFVLPVDAVPDFLPGVGYTDDLGVLAMAVATIAFHIDEQVKAETTRLLERWFP